MSDRRWFHYNTENQAEKCAVKVGVVIDIVIRLSPLVPGEEDIQCTHDEPGHADKHIQADIRQWLKDDIGEHDCGDASRRTQRIIPRVVTVFQICGNVGHHNREKIQRDEV